MKNLNLIKKKISKEHRKVSVNEPLKSLAEFFNGEFIKFAEEYTHES